MKEEEFGQSGDRKKSLNIEIFFKKYIIVPTINIFIVSLRIEYGTTIKTLQQCKITIITHLKNIFSQTLIFII